MYQHAALSCNCVMKPCVQLLTMVVGGNNNNNTAGSMCIAMNKTGNLSIYVEDCLV
jgi:hypothetical protein